MSCEAELYVLSSRITKEHLPSIVFGLPCRNIKNLLMYSV